jgi:hypothetical protein
MVTISKFFWSLKKRQRCLCWLSSSSSHWVNAEWDSLSTVSRLREAPRQLSQCKLGLNINFSQCGICQYFERFYHSVLIQLLWSLIPHWLCQGGESLTLNQLTGNETQRQLSHCEMIQKLDMFADSTIKLKILKFNCWVMPWDCGSGHYFDFLLAVVSHWTYFRFRSLQQN